MSSNQKFAANFRKVKVHQGFDISEYQKLRTFLEQHGIKYWNYIVDTASQADFPKIMYFFTPVLFLAPRAFKGSRGIPADQLKTYLIYVKQKDEEKVKDYRKNADIQNK